MMRLTSLLLKRLDRHGHRQVGLAGTGGPDPECDGMAADGSQIFLLSQCLRVDRFALCRHGDKIVVELFQPFFLTAAGKADAISYRLFLQRRVVLQQGGHAVHGMNGCLHILRFAGEFERRSTADCRNVECIFQHTDIFVAATENSSCSSMLSSSIPFPTGKQPPCKDISVCIIAQLSTKETVNIVQI